MNRRKTLPFDSAYYDCYDYDRERYNRIIYEEGYYNDTSIWRA